MASRTLTANQIRPALVRCIKKQRPAFLWGPPGIGKSELIQQITDQLGGLMLDLRMGQLDPTDLRGIPVPNKETKSMEFYQLDALPTEEEAKKYPVVVLFLDELTSAPPSVLAAGYQLILNRKVGKYVLPDNVVIVAAGNRESDKGVTFRMPMPLANRFVHFEMRVDFDTWLGWAIQHRIHKDIIGFLSFAPRDLYDFDPKSSSRAYATPRSWTFASDLLEEDGEDMDDALVANLIAGTVGDGIAVKFMAHRKYATKMPNPKHILDGTVTGLEIREVSAMYSLVTNMCYELKSEVENGVGSKKLHTMADNFFRFMMDNFETELVVMGARVALRTFELPLKATKLQHFDEFHDRYGKYIRPVD